ncbi:MAG: radical SAM protein [Thermoplasmata archaeon]
MKIRDLKQGSKILGELPRGCKICDKGAKLVLLVTGLCGKRCFYCPLSEKKMGRDVIYANEMLIKTDKNKYARKNDDEILDEAHKINALGTGITGGDPLTVIDRTVHFIEVLKNEFGEKHHIHLYTGNTPSKKDIERLADAGLDEIRFHPVPALWKNMEKGKFHDVLRNALNTNMDIGVEVPSLPDFKKELLILAKYLDDISIDFLNLNELEYSETNYLALMKKGYKAKTDLSISVKGSEKTAIEIMKKADINTLNIHYCSSSYKDAVQLKNRLGRRAKNVAHKYDIITKDNTLLKGAIEIPGADIRDLEKALRIIVSDYNIPKQLVSIDNEKCRIEIASWILEKIFKKIKYDCYIVEEYPTADRLEVERAPL